LHDLRLVAHPIQCTSPTGAAHLAVSCPGSLTISKGADQAHLYLPLLIFITSPSSPTSIHSRPDLHIYFNHVSPYSNTFRVTAPEPSILSDLQEIHRPCVIACSRSSADQRVNVSSAVEAPCAAQVDLICLKNTTYLAVCTTNDRTTTSHKSAQGRILGPVSQPCVKSHSLLPLPATASARTLGCKPIKARHHQR
jgi:hypothetical protein